MSEAQIVDKKGEVIRVGDVVSCRARGGRQYGKVEKIVTDEEQAEKLGVGPAPKVLYTDQHGHEVKHYPDALVHGEDPFDV